MPEHGGRLNQFAHQYSRPVEDWLDLSTGINPNGWPVPEVPAAIWSRLPEQDDALTTAATGYYQTPHLLAIAGSQAAIQQLPLLRPPSRIGMLHPAYAEHSWCWSQAGHEVISLTSVDIDQQIDQLDVLLIINPNNPTGEYFQPEDLLRWHQRLQQRQGWLIIDEAFIDTTPSLSLSPFSPRPGLIILRSLGKFFGLAGLRVGFVLAEQQILDKMENRLGPWTIANPSRYIAQHALTDRAWQQQNRIYLNTAAQRLAKLLEHYQLAPTGGTALFQWVKHKEAVVLHHHLAQHGILTRLFEQPASLRFGLPANESDWKRLKQALATISLGEKLSAS